MQVNQFPDLYTRKPFLPSGDSQQLRRLGFWV